MGKANTEIVKCAICGGEFERRIKSTTHTGSHTRGYPKAKNVKTCSNKCSKLLIIKVSREGSERRRIFLRDLRREKKAKNKQKASSVRED